MLTYDVYLKKRLTEIDVIITQLVQRDSFSMYDWLNIFASIEDDLEIRWIKVRNIIAYNSYM